MRAAMRAAKGAAVALMVMLGSMGCDAETAPVIEGDDAEVLDAAPLDRAVVGDAAPGDAGDIEGDRGPDAGLDAALMLDPDLGADASALGDAVVDPIEVPRGPSNAWGPAARVSSLDIPSTPDEARRAGCLLRGPAVGTKLYSVLLLAGGGLRTQVRPGPGGRIELVLLTRARNWPVGTAAAGLETVDIDVMPGVQDEAGGFHYDVEGFIDGDPAAGARSSFADTWVDDGWLDSDLITLSFRLSLLGTPRVPFTLQQARLTGRIAADGEGFRIEQGSIAGYLTLEQLVELIVEVQRFCSTESPPGICGLIGGQLDRPVDELTELIVGFVNGLEVRVEGNTVSDCDPMAPDDCNALGVCLELGATPVIVEGARAAGE